LTKEKNTAPKTKAHKKMLHERGSLQKK